MKICILTYNYPGRHNATDYAFVKELVDAFAQLGHSCYVLCPYNFLHYHCFSPIYEKYAVGNGSVEVYRPWYLSFSNIRLGDFSISQWFHQRAINRAFKKLSICPDVIYGHFWHTAFEGFEYAKKNRIPLFVATGESAISFRRTLKTRDFCDYVAGVICVSSKNRDESIALGLTTFNKCEVFPNAVDLNLFRKRDKLECRELLHLPKDKFIVAYVGWFNERKGSRRLAEAMNSLKEPIYSLFIGTGEDVPNCRNILFCGTVKHEDLPNYLNAADIFVLPTLKEGCCNAIVEAMACGLPIVSSDLPFNRDILNNENSILIDPIDIGAISEAILKLYYNKAYINKLSVESLRKSQGLSIKKRSFKILDFFKI